MQAGNSRATSRTVGGRVVATDKQLPDRPIGFQRLPGFIKAARADDVTRWCGVSCQLIAPVANKLPLPLRARDGLRDLDALAGDLPWLPIDDLRCYVDGELAYTLALDHRNTTDRLRAIVARAYGEAERVMDAYADFLEFLGSLDQQIATIARAAKLCKKLPDIMAVVGRWRWDREEVAKGRIQAASDSAHLLADVVELLQDLKRSGPGRGRTKDMAKLFFVIRLGETFAFSTGLTPKFYWSDNANRFGNYAPTPWHRLLQCAFDIIGIRFSGPSINHVLRRINGMLAHRAVIKHIAQWSSTLGNSEPGVSRKSWHHGDCQSVGLQIDWLVPRGGGPLAPPWKMPRILHY